MKAIINIICILFLSTSCIDSKEEADEPINFKIEPDFEQQLLKVKVNYHSDEEGRIILKYENDSWGDSDIYNCINKLTSIPEADSIVFDRVQSFITIFTKPGTATEINYEISQDFEAPLLNQHRYRPIIEDSYFNILGMRLFILKDDLFRNDSSKVSLKVEWHIPDSLSFHSSFGPERTQIIRAKREEFYASIFVGGDFRVFISEVMDSPVYFLSRGNWTDLKLEEIFLILQQTLWSQHKFWNDSIGPLYSVTLLPTEEEWTEYSRSNSIGGSGLSNSFISFASNNPGTTNDRIRWLYNHELFHKWFNGKMKNESEEKQYWFSEGFTDFYAYKLMLMNDHLSLSAYLDVINNQVLLPHYSSEVGEIPNDSITWNRFWADYRVHKLPYYRGFVYALMIDHQIKEKSNYKLSLNQMVKDIYAESVQSGKPFNHELFKKYLQSYLDETALEDFERYIINGQYIDLSNNLPQGLEWIEESGIPVITMSGDSSLIHRRMKL